MRIIDWSSDVCSSDLNDVHRPREQDLDGATEEACDEAERDAGTEGDGDDDGAHIEGVARTVDEPRQDIAADGVGAEPEFPASALHPYRRCQEVLAELLDRRVRRPQVGADGEQHQDAENGRTAWRESVGKYVEITGVP